MECDRVREAISARIDGEDGGIPDDVLAAHLAGCADCRSWEQRAHVVTRRARLGGAFLDRDLTERVLAAVPPAPTRRLNRITQRTALVAVAIAQFAITVPLLILGHDHDAGVHAAHELGSFDLALAIAFCVGAIRPALSAGLAWPCTIAAGSLVGTAIIDLIGGQTIGIDEAQHLIALAGALLLIWQARTVGAGTAEPQGAGVPRDGRHSRTLPADPAADALAGFPLWGATTMPSDNGTDAARADDPVIAARADGTSSADSRADDSGPAGTGRQHGSGSDPQEAVA
jgi:predicted anti-sigma-YlaC factor YlaD